MNWMVMLMMAAVAAAEPPAPAVDAGADLGKKVYAAKCVTCHAKDGKGTPAMAKMFRVNISSMNLVEATVRDTDSLLTKTILNGRGKMPSWKGKLKDEEIAGVLSYIHSLAPAKAAAASEAPKAAPSEAPKASSPAAPEPTTPKTDQK